jgi:hypothetical protein
MFYNLFQVDSFDFCDSISISSLGKTKYIVLFCEDIFHSVFIYLIKSKSEFSQYLAQFIEYIKIQFRVTFQVLRSDKSGEYTSNIVKDILSQYGIYHKFTFAHTYTTIVL